MTPDAKRQEATTLRVLRWYGLGASTRRTVWAGFRRTTITAAFLTLIVAAVGGLAAGESREAATAEEVIYVVPALWTTFVLVVTLPGVIRSIRKASS